MKKNKIGLVLSGGGAKGAYQVGVIKALVELGSEVDAISGASIGALNAAVIACSQDLTQASERLENLWLSLSTKSPLEKKDFALLNLLASAGLDRISFGTLSDVDDKSIYSSGPLHKLMNQYLNIDSLQTGIPLYVSIYKTEGIATDLFKITAASLGISENKNSDFFHIQSQPENDRKNIILASAALPLLFKAKTINGSKYRDGGMGGWQKMQGNTPITPLINNGYKTIIVTHLTDGSLWSREDFPNTTILEIRPQSPIQRDSFAKDLLGFDTTKIPSWIEQGYQDTMHCIGSVMQASKARNELKISEMAIEQSEERLNSISGELNNAMARLK